MQKSFIDENAEKILRKRYYRKDENDNIIENWDGLCRRVVDNILTDNTIMDYSITDMRDLCYDMIHNLDFLPNSPTLSNAGTEQCLSACFVCPLENSINSIFQTIHDAVLIHKSGGGTGFNFTKIKRSKLLDNNHIYFCITLSENHSDFNDFIDTHINNLAKITLEPLTKKLNIIKESEDRYSITIYTTPNNEQLLIIDIKDSMDDIFNFNKLYNTIEIIKDKGKPIVFNFTNVRSKDSLISTTNTKASGPVSFMKAYDAFIEYITNDITPITTIKFFNACTESVKQGGMRRGANMGILNYDSEFIEEFICCKQNDSSINNFNISVGVTDDRLLAREISHADEDEVRLKDYSNKDVRLTDKTISLSKLLDDLVYFAWKNGEPGVIFLDKINDKNPVPDTVIESTNPCGEQPLLPYESCNLGSINLVNMIKTNDNGANQFDLRKFKQTIGLAVRFMDDFDKI